jgi:hypothetical protein
MHKNSQILPDTFAGSVHVKVIAVPVKFVELHIFLFLLQLNNSL